MELVNQVTPQVLTATFILIQQPAIFTSKMAVYGSQVEILKALKATRVIPVLQAKQVVMVSMEQTEKMVNLS